MSRACVRLVKGRRALDTPLCSSVGFLCFFLFNEAGGGASSPGRGKSRYVRAVPERFVERIRLLDLPGNCACSFLCFFSTETRFPTALLVRLNKWWMSLGI